MNVAKVNRLLESAVRELSARPRRPLGEAHHITADHKVYVDTAFINATRHLPGTEVKHMGMGEFTLVTPDGEVEFDRMRGKPFEGQEGRSHLMYDSNDGPSGKNPITAKVIAAMEHAKKSQRVESRMAPTGRVTEAAGPYAKANALVAKAVAALVDAGLTQDAKAVRAAGQAKDQLSAHKLIKALHQAVAGAEDGGQEAAMGATADAKDAVEAAASFAITKGLEQPLPPQQARQYAEYESRNPARTAISIVTPVKLGALTNEEKKLIRRLVLNGMSTGRRPSMSY